MGVIVYFLPLPLMVVAVVVNIREQWVEVMLPMAEMVVLAVVVLVLVGLVHKVA
tara:strand:+ start:288 stop:449 length:162 start_codon:yes stop_codon:yes gene_type:complete